jgi:hypothetical protein
MKPYRIIEYTKGMHTWYEVEEHKPMFWNKDRWKPAMKFTKMMNLVKVEFNTLYEAKQYADNEYAPIARKIIA